ncbi:MAG: hypothetical protein ACJ74L_08565, partial [Gaiellaceae bacterium]
PAVRRRAVVRPPLAAAARDGALRVVVRRVPVERVAAVRRRAVVRPPFAAAAFDGARRVVVRRRVPPLLLELELVVRRRVPPVDREREVVLRARERDDRARLVEARRPGVDDATREIASSSFGSSCWIRMGVSSTPSLGGVISPND